MARCLRVTSAFVHFLVACEVNYVFDTKCRSPAGARCHFYFPGRDLCSSDAGPNQQGRHCRDSHGYQWGRSARRDYHNNQSRYQQYAHGDQWRLWPVRSALAGDWNVQGHGYEAGFSNRHTGECRFTDKRQVENRSHASSRECLRSGDRDGGSAVGGNRNE